MPKDRRGRADRECGIFFLGTESNRRIARYPTTADSGNKIDRKFCLTCGTHLFSGAEVRPHLVFVRVGTLDNPEIAKPLATIWVSSAPSWAAIDPNLPQIEGQPPPQPALNR
jgi:hypothetical protein